MESNGEVRCEIAPRVSRASGAFAELDTRMGLFSPRPKSAGGAADAAKRVSACLAELQDLLPALNDAHKVAVGQKHAYATNEFLDGLAHTFTSSSGVRGARDLTQAEFIESRIRLTLDSPKLMLILVGLPARGKSMIGHKLQDFLAWRGWTTKTFSVGARRRSVGPAGGSAAGGRAAHTAASFFDGSKAYALAAREAMAMEVLDDCLAWFDAGGQVAIFDATNGSLQRRGKLTAAVEAHAARAGVPIGTVFVESICANQGRTWCTPTPCTSH